MEMIIKHERVRELPNPPFLLNLAKNTSLICRISSSLCEDQLKMKIDLLRNKPRYTKLLQ